MRKLSSSGENYDEYENYDSDESFENRSNNGGGKNGSKSSQSNYGNKNNYNRNGNNNSQTSRRQGGNNRAGENWGSNWTGEWSRRYKRQFSYPSFGTYDQYGFGNAGQGGFGGFGSDFRSGSYGGNRQSNRNNYGSNRQNEWEWSGGYENTSNRGTRDNQNRNDQGQNQCIMQCFFQEMKMTNTEGFPDRHRVLHVITDEMRNRELKEFYTDSIQECFAVLELDNKQEKCRFSKNLVTCLTERAKTNCDDWNSDGNVLFQQTQKN